jgi:S1-C subfamily serine protease
MSELLQFSNEISSAATLVSSSVVAIHGRQRFSSSGIIWRNGLVVTSDAALRRDEDIRVMLPDGTITAATVRGRDASTDLALLACETGKAVPVIFSKDTAKLAGVILTVGRTVDTGPIVTMGIVSGVANDWRTWRGAKLDEFVRLDTAIYPTSVGGAVVDSTGGVIGMVAGGLSRSSVLAITRRTIERVADVLASKGRVARGYIGVGIQPVAIPAALRQQFNLTQETAVMALSVEENGPAARAGVTMGDVIVKLAGHEITSPEALHGVLDPGSVGQQLAVSILRSGALHELTVTVAERPVRNPA